MPPKKGKKKIVKKVVTNPLEERMAESLSQRLGGTTDGSEYGSELNPTPREGVDDSFQGDQSFQEHKEEEDNYDSTEKKLNQSADNIDTKTTVTIEENKESKHVFELQSSGNTNEVGSSDNVYEAILREKEEKYKDDMLQSFHDKPETPDLSVKAHRTEGEDIDNLSKDFQDEEQGRILEEERLRLTTVVDKLEKDLNQIDNQVKTQVHNVTYQNMDAQDKLIQSIQEQLKHIEIPTELIQPEFKVAFADLQDELDLFSLKKSTLNVQLTNKLDEIAKLNTKRDQEIKEEVDAINEVKQLLAKEDYDQAEKVLQRVVYHKLDDTLVLVQEIKELRQKKEDHKKKEQEEALKQSSEEQKILEEEKKKKEQDQNDKKQKEEELKKQEEERLRKESELQKQKEEEERRQKEQAERIKKELEAEQERQKHEQERKQRENEQEQKRLAEQQRKQEEQKQRDDAERQRKAAEDERQQQQEHERLRKESLERERLKVLQDQQKKKEEEEEQKRKLQEQKQREADEERRKIKEQEQKTSQFQQQLRQDLTSPTGDSQQQEKKTKKDDKEGGGSYPILAMILGFAVVGGLVGYKFILKK